ncbi:Spc98 family-domain-containing protein [Aspergillus pseudoustus]|uniref:Spindle pole body component n=1 Tax=Aspergillus pseudoustus TaxID=1810923 RepID=A0ABR4KNB7_9EURO
MEHEDYGSDPFSSDGLWRISQFTLDSLQPIKPLPWNEKLDLPVLPDDIFQSPLDPFDKENSKLHELNIFGANLSEPSLFAESVADTSSDTQLETREVPDGELEDLWAPASYGATAPSDNALNSWERYHVRGFTEPRSVYFGESGAKGFDAALENHSKRTSGKPSSVARNDVFFQSLFRLGLGWSSMLFRYNERQQKFEKVIKDLRIHGVSALALSGMMDELLQCGTNMQQIRAFIGRVPSKAAEPSALSAFSTATSVVIYTLEKQLLICANHISSVLQVRALFQQCGELVGALANMAAIVERAGSEAQIISSVFKLAAHYSHIHGQMEDLFREIVFKVAGPWLDYVESWIGFRPETAASVERLASGQSFVFVEKYEEKGKLQSQERHDYVYLPEQMPSFVPPDQAQLIYESGRSLRLLKRSHPNHPLASEKRWVTEIPNLHGAGTWIELERIQTKARDYESRLRAEILKYNRGGLEQPKTRVGDTDGGYEGLPDAFDLFDIDDTRNTTGLLTNKSLEEGKLQRLATEGQSPKKERRETNFAPEVTSSLYLSLAPVLSSQALLIDYSCLHLLFKEHKLREHLNLQWRFQLLGDGYFTSRLSHSLFDPEMESGERKTGVVRSGVHTGLRLGSRDSWPPASSELRLVLMGILNECYSVEHTGGSGNPEFQKEKELPGGLSFSIRELTEEEITKCKNPNAIEALDFLRLQYKPSNVLKAIITQHSLHKYDLLFKQLLRLLRMISVVKGLIRDSTARNSLSGDTRNVLQRFRIDCQHFVLSLSDYCFQLGIGSTWQRFQDTLSRVETCLERGDIDGTIEAAHSIPRLRTYHEDTLDQMLFALFLSKRHTEVAKLIDDIFGAILKFAPLSRMDGMHGVRNESETVIKRLYTVFTKQVSALVGYLRRLDGARSSSRSKGRSGTFAAREAPTNVFDHLLVRLDMRKYY